MSVKKILSVNGEKARKSAIPARKALSLNSNNRTSSPEAMDSSNGAVALKKRRTDKCFSFSEINIEKPAGSTSLKDVDSNKLKAEIKRWAKAVVKYARQVSDRFARSSSNGGG
ncbi:uncharacterized protein LOC108955632 [Eucalyptus grandis]|uniref:Uncharacterized protein n=2 Tax=Eucalyptus grandis TaxID=71139 RepID=A0ACC3JAD2_EUCGR|nr:uncharacterized protein LOC108955632 [Eucalyptus grandis]KAK3410862.1 hypothetical protein EUGRSUZ_J02889 [Eucalyptus grandis]